MIDLNIEWEVVATNNSQIEVVYKCDTHEIRLNIPISNDLETSVCAHSPTKYFWDLINPNKPDHSALIGSKGQFTTSIDPSNPFPTPFPVPGANIIPKATP